MPVAVVFADKTIHAGLRPGQIGPVSARVKFQSFYAALKDATPASGARVPVYNWRHNPYLSCLDLT